MSIVSDRLLRLSTCWKITRTDEVELYFTDHDVPLRLEDGNLYLPAGGFSPSARQGQQGLKDNNFEVKGMIDSDIVDFEDLRAGKYREAQVIEYVVDWSNPGGTPVDIHKHWIAQTVFNGQSWEAQLAGQSFWLNRPVGRTYTLECDADLGDGRCKKDLTAFTFTGTVTVVQKARKSFVSDLTTGHLTGDFDDSNITWLTGKNANYGKTQVKHYLADGSFSLQLFSAKDIQVGDTFSVYRACNKLLDTCIDVFDNVDNFRGHPYLPGTDKYLRTPSTT